MLTEPIPSTPQTVLSTMRERETNAEKKGESISMFACVEEDRVLRFVSTVSSARRAAFTAPVLLLQGCPELV